jgi:hypothetical protein
MKTNLKYATELVEGINEWVMKSHEQIKRTTIPVTARDLAGKNLPLKDEPSFEPYVGPIRGSYTAIKKDIQIRFKGGIQKFLGVLFASHFTQKILEIKQKIKVLQEKINNLELDLHRSIVPWNYTVYKKLTAILAILAISDITWTTSSMLSLSDVLIIAVVIGIVLGLSQIFATKAAVLAIRQIQNPHKRTKYYLIAIFGALLFSVIIGLFRDNYVRHNTNTIISFWGSNFIVFAFINMVPILATALLLHYFYPTKEQMEEIKKYDELKREIKKCTTEIKILEEDQRRFEIQRMEGISLNEKMMHDEVKLLEKVDAYYDESIGLFKNENIIRRSDGSYPACFKNAHEKIPNPVIDHFNIPPKEVS